MLMYLYGLDSYRRNARLQFILAEFKKKHAGGTVEQFDLGEKDAIDRLVAFTKDQSLFAKVKLGIVLNADEEEGSHKILKPLLEDNATTLIIVSDKKLPKEFAFLLKAPARTELFDELESQEAFTYLRKELPVQNISITDTDLKNLIALHGGNLWTIIHDAEKLSLGGAAEKNFEPPQFFTLIQSLKSSSPQVRLSALACILAFEEPAAAFNVFASLTSGPAKRMMARYDIAVKSGKIEYEEALLDAVLSS